MPDVKQSHDSNGQPADQRFLYPNRCQTMQNGTAKVADMIREWLLNFRGSYFKGVQDGEANQLRGLMGKYHFANWLLVSESCNHLS